MWGYSIEEHVNRSMLFAGWCDTVMRWEHWHDKERKYQLSDSLQRFATRQVIDLARFFYLY